MGALLLNQKHVSQKSNAHRHRQKVKNYRRRRIAVLSPFLLLAILVTLLYNGDSRSAATRSERYKRTESISRVNSSPVLKVVSVNKVRPPAGSLGMDDIAVHFSTALDKNDPSPILDPSLPGHWVKQNSTTIVFDPDPGYVSTETEKVVVPDGIRARIRTVRSLTHSVESTLSPLNPEILRIQEALAGLSYLPVHFTETLGHKNNFSKASMVTSHAHPPSGTFSWRWSTLPDTLRRLWQPGNYGVITQGAVMAFERTHQMIVNKTLTSGLLKALAVAVQNRSVDPDPYCYVEVSEASPEYLTVFEDGSSVFHSLANTGIENSTPIGTWPIYLRRGNQTLRGTYPNGVPYDIPDVRYLNYFDGNYAIHAFNRSSYGFPQSAGCVELPPDAAAQVWRYVHYGTLVTVT